MKILAVIPARAGSKGIPNKNIRIVAGHPLIYYSIQNAKKSQYITDIIVTTDSSFIKIISEHMGVVCKDRNKNLCGDNITLDSVIYDAIPKNCNWDYIVTMQPTSPTLNVETLDKAIKYTIDNNLDTCISVVNEPHLSWSEQNGKKLPNYKERLNRQYLPPYYKETGAFIISKASIVNEKTRIGKKVDIYEVSENESYDIDNFSDLYNVESVLNKEKVAIYVNGNNLRGMGHVYRALEVSDEFFSKPDIYYDINQTDVNIFGKTTHNLIPVNSIAELFKHCKEKQYTVFINDILSTSIDYMIALRSFLPEATIVNFEDDGEGISKADLVFNALLPSNEQGNLYSGEKYYIASKLFMFYSPINISKYVKTVFISFGGADPQNYSDRLLKIISKAEYNNYNFIVVLGKSKQNIAKLLEYNNKYSNIKVLCNVDNMPELMSECDIAITSRGRTGYELALLGIPTISMAQNKNEEKHKFICNENGFTYIGLNPKDEIIEGNLRTYLKLSKDSRKEFQNKLLKHDLRNGRDRVMNLIKNRRNIYV